MPDIKPFRAWRYNLIKIRKPSTVVAPPYDVISVREQERLYEVNPYNVIRLELGKQRPGDNETDNVYTRARHFMDQWKSDNVLLREDKPALYVYVQDYVAEGKKKTRTGFYAAMKLDEKAVLKHENTLTGPKEDRLKLLKEVCANLSPIFGLFEDKKGAVQSQLKRSLKTTPLLDISLDGVRHRLYLEDRQPVMRAIVRTLKAKPMFIADGHHRFEVACQFKKWMSAKRRGGFVRKSRLLDGYAAICGEQGKSGTVEGAPWNYVLTYFSDCLHNPFKIFPTHRLIRSEKCSDGFQTRLNRHGALQKMKDLGAVLSRLKDCREDTKDKRYRFGVYSEKEGFWILTLGVETGFPPEADPPPADKPVSTGTGPVDKLDVTVLHKKILEPCFDIRAVEKSQSIDFTRDPEEAVKKVRDGLFDLAFFLRPTSLREMLFVSKKGLKMPQKSTYFYPKLLTGLVFYGFD